MPNFKIGDKVKYVSDHYGDEITNPKWGGNYGNIAGKIDGGCDNSWEIEWDNGEHNSGYEDDDLELIIKTINTKGMKNLAAAAKALKRSGPTSQWAVGLHIHVKVDAHDEEEAIEIARNDYNNNNMTILKGIGMQTMNINQI